MKKVYIILQNGRVFEGKTFGAEDRVVGEIVFSTSMTGYLEALTDPRYYGQILVQTFPLIGNYGIIEEDFQSEKVYPAAYVVREYCDMPSNYRCESDIDSWFKKKGIVGVYGIDTRALTEAIREYGVMNAIITDEAPEPVIPAELLTYAIKDSTAAVTCKEKTVYAAKDASLSVALYDFGVTKSVIDSLLPVGCSVTRFPASTPAEEILEGGFDGVLLSAGPGNPAENMEYILEIRKLIGKTPIFAMGIGHQMLAIAAGAKTSKLKYGHRGANQPVRDLKSGKVNITSQNHGYVVNPDILPYYASVRFIKANDGTVEGLEYKDMYALSIQFSHDACSGPRGSGYLYSEFVDLMKEFKAKEGK